MVVRMSALLPLLPEPATSTSVWVSGPPGHIHLSQSGSLPVFALCFGRHTLFIEERILDHPVGQDVGCGQPPEGNSLHPVESEAFRFRKANLWALVSQAVSRRRSKSWPGSLGDPITFPKEGSLERTSGASPPPFPHWRMDRLIVPGMEAWGDTDYPQCQAQQGPKGLFLLHTKFSSAEVLVLSVWLRPPCSFLIRDTTTTKVSSLRPLPSSQPSP